MGVNPDCCRPARVLACASILVRGFERPFMEQSAQPELDVAIWRGGRGGGAFRSYRVPQRADQTVLDVVTWVQRNLEPGLAYRFACRVGMCGSCAMTVNGRPRWTCRSHVDKVAPGGRLEIGPLPNLPVIRDLATDMTGFFEKWQAAGGRFAPSASRADPPAKVAPESPARKAADAGIECINCGVCATAPATSSGGRPGLSWPCRTQPRLDAGQRRTTRQRPRRNPATRWQPSRRLPRSATAHGSCTEHCPVGLRSHRGDRRTQAPDLVEPDGLQGGAARERSHWLCVALQRGCPLKLLAPLVIAHLVLIVIVTPCTAGLSAAEILGADAGQRRPGRTFYALVRRSPIAVHAPIGVRNVDARVRRGGGGASVDARDASAAFRDCPGTRARAPSLRWWQWSDAPLPASSRMPETRRRVIPATPPSLCTAISGVLALALSSCRLHFLTLGLDARRTQPSLDRFLRIRPRLPLGQGRGVGPRGAPRSPSHAGRRPAAPRAGTAARGAVCAPAAGSDGAAGASRRWSASRFSRQA